MELNIKLNAPQNDLSKEEKSFLDFCETIDSQDNDNKDIPALKNKLNALNKTNNALDKIMKAFVFLSIFGLVSTMASLFLAQASQASAELSAEVLLFNTFMPVALMVPVVLCLIILSSKESKLQIELKNHSHPDKNEKIKCLSNLKNLMDSPIVHHKIKKKLEILSQAIVNDKIVNYKIDSLNLNIDFLNNYYNSELILGEFAKNEDIESDNVSSFLKIINSSSAK